MNAWRLEQPFHQEPRFALAVQRPEWDPSGGKGLTVFSPAVTNGQEWPGCARQISTVPLKPFCHRTSPNDWEADFPRLLLER
jgi:hypothetical protein